MTPPSGHHDSTYLDATGHSNKDQCHCWKKWSLAATNMYPCGKRQMTSHIVNSCPQSKQEGAAVMAFSWWHCCWMAEDIRLVNALDNNNNFNATYPPNHSHLSPLRWPWLQTHVLQMNYKLCHLNWAFKLPELLASTSSPKWIGCLVKVIPRTLTANKRQYLQQLGFVGFILLHIQISI